MEAHYAPWVPENDKDRLTVRTALGDVLQSAHFRNSKRYPALLSYLVEEVLAGRTEIKERTLGIEVFGRPADYDTNTDTAVRYTAGEIRKRLALYYHTHPTLPVQIALTSRSYVPEFLRLEAEAPSADIASPQPLVEPTPSTSLAAKHRSAKLFLWGGIALICIVLLGAGGLAWRMSYIDPQKNFWTPLLAGGETVLISPGGNVWDGKTKADVVQPADEKTPTPFLSFGNGLALGRMASDISRYGGHYRVEAAGLVPLSHLSEGPVVLIGAYNNPWTERLLLPLRFHFVHAPEKAIVDSSQAGRMWQHEAVDAANSPDYALVARFRSHSTGQFVVVAAGLKGFGTDAASQFISSPENLRQLDARLGSGWWKRNIEVILKVDVASGRTGAPQILDTYAW